MSPIIASTAALAIGGGLLIGAPPAQAGSGGAGVQCSVAADQPDPVKPAKNAWTDKYGTAALPFNGGAAAGGTSGGLTQNAPGSPKFTVQSPLDDSVGLGPAQPGIYEVSVGDGICGQTMNVPVKEDGQLDLSKFRQLNNTKGQEMVQVRGPLNTDPKTRNQGKYVDRKGTPRDLPDTYQGAIYYAHKNASVPVQADLNSARNGGTGLPVIDQGSTSIPLRFSTSLRLNNRVNSPVTVTYRDAEKHEAQSHKIHAFLGGGPDGLKSLSGDELGTLPSGRYRLSFSDGYCHTYQVFVLIGDGTSTNPTGLLYAPVH